MIGMRRCLECGCKVRYVQMSPDVVLECQECGLKVVGISYLRGQEYPFASPQILANNAKKQ